MVTPSLENMAVSYWGWCRWDSLLVTGHGHAEAGQEEKPCGAPRTFFLFRVSEAIRKEGMMEKVLRCVGPAFLVAVHAFGEIRNVIRAYLQDLASDDHLEKQRCPITAAPPPPNHLCVNSRIIVFPSPARKNHLKIHAKKPGFRREFLKRLFRLAGRKQTTIVRLADWGTKPHRYPAHLMRTPFSSASAPRETAHRSPSVLFLSQLHIQGMCRYLQFRPTAYHQTLTE